MVVKDGRFGPYVTDGETNASLRKGDTVENVTIERAAELLQIRREAAPVKRAKKAKKAPAKKSAAKKAPAKTTGSGEEEAERGVTSERISGDPGSDAPTEPVPRWATATPARGGTCGCSGRTSSSACG